MESLIRTSLMLPTSLQRGLRDAAERLGRSQTDILREALQAYLDKLAAPLPKSIGIASDAELSGADSEAWLAREWDKRKKRAK